MRLGLPPAPEPAECTAPLLDWQSAQLRGRATKPPPGPTHVQVTKHNFAESLPLVKQALAECQVSWPSSLQRRRTALALLSAACPPTPPTVALPLSPPSVVQFFAIGACPQQELEGPQLSNIVAAHNACSARVWQAWCCWLLCSTLGQSCWQCRQSSSTVTQLSADCEMTGLFLEERPSSFLDDQEDRYQEASGEGSSKAPGTACGWY